MSVVPDEAKTELERVWDNRCQEALQAGMSLGDARDFADSRIDIGDLRHLVELGCDGDTAARILL